MKESDQQGQNLMRILEAVLSASDAPLTPAKMKNLFPEQACPNNEEIIKALDDLASFYKKSALELVKVAGGYRFQTRVAYADWINKLFETRPPKLSRALLETLSIIAYQQPVTRGDIQEIRGIAVSSEIIQRLLAREWIKKVGERDVPGRPALWATTGQFLAYFNIQSLTELPKLPDLREPDLIAKQVLADNELDLMNQETNVKESENVE